MRCVKLLDYTIPMFGNKRSTTYGNMLVEHEGIQKVVRFGVVDGQGRNYIVFNRKRYFFRNTGSLYAPTFVF